MLLGLTSLSDVMMYFWLHRSPATTRHLPGQTLLRENGQNKSEFIIHGQETGGEDGWIEDTNFCGTENRKLEEQDRIQIRFKQHRRRIRGDTKEESKRYSRNSRTLAPGTALIVWFDVRLHPVLHHTANSACHHISTPVPTKSHTQAGKRKLPMNDCVMTGS